MNEPVLVTLLVINVLETLDVPYLIGGSFASTVYAQRRMSTLSPLLSHNMLMPF